MYYPFVRKALFQLDPERAHEFTFQQLRRITGTPFEALVRQKVPAKPVNCMGLTFKNPLGLAAGQWWSAERDLSFRQTENRYLFY
uniref:hypothetical protein n=1 Tax=Flavobacterium sp. TaxID=239 RepID=UPI0040481B6D